MPLKRILICLFFIFGITFQSSVSAWIVPGSILKASQSSSALQCNTSNSSEYKTSYNCTQTNSCAVYQLDRSASCGCETYKQETDYSNCVRYGTATCKTYGTKNGTTCLERNNDATCAEFETHTVTWCQIWVRFFPQMRSRECSYEWGTMSSREVPTWTCKTYNNDATCKRYNQVTDYNNCTAYNDAPCEQYGTKNSTTCSQYKECRSSQHGCESYKTSPTFATATYKNMEANQDRPTLSSIYNLPNGYVYYANEGNNSCYVAVNGSNHTPASKLTQTQCSLNNSSYYTVGGRNGICNISSNRDYLISSYNQLWAVTNSTPSGNNNTCRVEWRIAIQDNTGPSVNVVSKNFTNDTTKWCNLEKYKWTWAENDFPIYGSDKSPTTQGCEYYKNLSSFEGNNPDLISDLAITITDQSALSKLNIELGTCSANIALTTDLSKLENNGNGVKNEVRSIVLYGHKSTSYAGQSIASLKTLFKVARLDDCLANGRNYIRVTAKDNARSSSNVAVLNENSTVMSTKSTQFINIDNIGVSFGTDSSDPSSSTIWYDNTVSGKFVFQDYADYGDPICKAYEKWDAHTCTGKPNNSYWVSPSGVNPNTWEHNIYTCDGEPLSVNGCDWTCDIWYEKKDGKCEPIITETTCWTLGISRLSHDTKLCSYTPIYTWRTKADTVCNGSYYLQSSVCKDQYGNLASNDMCDDPEPATTVPCTLEWDQGFTIGRDKIGDNSKTIW